MKTFDLMSLPDLLITKKAYEDLNKKCTLILDGCVECLNDVSAAETATRIERLTELIKAVDERISTLKIN